MMNGTSNNENSHHPGVKVELSRHGVDLEKLEYKVELKGRTYDVPDEEWLEEAIKEKKEREERRHGKHYPTPIHELFEVEPRQPFELDIFTHGAKPRFHVDVNGNVWRITQESGNHKAKAGHIVLAINNPKLRKVLPKEWEEEEMQEVRFPTKMHKLTQKEPFQEFYVKITNRPLYLNELGDLMGVDTNGDGYPVPSDLVCWLINNLDQINDKPIPLNEQQIEQLKALVVLGLLWLAKDKGGCWVMATMRMPTKGKDGWYGGWPAAYLDSESCLAPLVDWEDTEPLSILKVLKENGVEVENG